MALRLVDVYLPEGYDGLEDLEDEHAVLGRWNVELEGDRRLLRVLLDTGDTEALLDWLDDEIGLAEDYRVVLLPVEATVPRPEIEENEKEKEEAAAEEGSSSTVARISKEELYQDVVDAIKSSKVYHTFVVLSTVVAAGGMLRDNAAVVIGAMVIAPLLGPNIALALATTLGDADLLRRGLRINVIGVSIALVVALAIGFFFPVDPATPELAARTDVGLGDIALALAAGVAGALSFSRGLPSALIGVMVAVALLPPLVAAGMLAGAGYWTAAYGALLLLLTNVVCVNLAGVVTFLLQGIRPNRWYEAEQAKKATRRAIALWIVLLAVLVVAILLAPKRGAF